MNAITSEKQVVKFDVTEAGIAEMKKLYGGLKITDLDDPEQYDMLHAAHMVVRGKRTAVEKRAKKYNEEALAHQRAVNAKKNHIVGLIEPLESHLKGEKQKVKDEIKRREDAQEALIREKIRRISAVYFDLNSAGTVAQLNIVIDELNAMDIQPTEYFNFTTEAIEKRDEILIIANQNRDTRLRLDAEEAERKAEAEHQAKVAAEQAEIAAKQKAAQDKIDEANRKIEEENERIETEKKKSDGKRVGLRLKELRGVTYDGEMVKDSKGSKVLFTHDNLINLSDSEFDAIAKPHNDMVAARAKKKAEQERKDREEFERQAKEDARIKAEQDAKDWEEFDRQERAEAEKAAKESAIKAEMLRPEKDKVIAFSQFLAQGITYPKVESPEFRSIVEDAHDVIQKVSKRVLERVQEI